MDIFSFLKLKPKLANDLLETQTEGSNKVKTKDRKSAQRTLAIACEAIIVLHLSEYIIKYILSTGNSLSSKRSRFDKLSWTCPRAVYFLLRKYVDIKNKTSKRVVMIPPQLTPRNINR